jgi:effector-binding domain-containing protein
MPPDESPIERKIVPATRVAGSRKTLKGREEIQPAIEELAGIIPPEVIAGPPVCVFQYITDVEEAYDVEILFPVSRALEAQGLFCRTDPELEVLAHVHRGPSEGLRDAYRELYGTAAAHAIISDEFGREVYSDWGAPEPSTIEIQFVVHRWDDLLARHVERVLGAETTRELLRNRPAPGLATTGDERFAWVKGVVETL